LTPSLPGEAMYDPKVTKADITPHLNAHIQSHSCARLVKCQSRFPWPLSLLCAGQSVELCCIPSAASCSPAQTPCLPALHFFLAEMGKGRPGRTWKHHGLRLQPLPCPSHGNSSPKARRAFVWNEQGKPC